MILALVDYKDSFILLISFSISFAYIFLGTNGALSWYGKRTAVDTSSCGAGPDAPRQSSSSRLNPDAFSVPHLDRLGSSVRGLTNPKQS